jgi:hypothetical protein
VGGFGAKNAVTAVQKLENMGRAGNSEESAETLSVHELEIFLFTSAVSVIAKALVSCCCLGTVMVNLASFSQPPKNTEW